MWKYLKDYLIGKLLDKWILQTDLNLTNNNNKNSFLHYTNIELNPETFTKSLQNSLNLLELNYGAIEELTVEINWTEIFRYWTEIKSKYHVNESDGSESEYDPHDEIYEGKTCNIKIRNLRLNLRSCISPDKNSKTESYDFPASETELDNTDLIRDFLDHILGQFKVEIEGISVNIDNDLSISIPGWLITPEINGIRKIILLENVNIKYLDADLNIKKNTEVILMRSIENYRLKFSIPEIKLEAKDLNFLKLPHFMKFEKQEESSNSLSFEIALDLVKVNIATFLSISIHDIYADDSGAFIVGHFESSWKDRIVFLESPVQTHVITGNYKRSIAEIDEEITFSINEINELKQFFSIFDFQTEKKSSQVLFSLKIKSIKAKIEEYDLSLACAHFTGSGLNIDAIHINRNNSDITINNATYTRNKRYLFTESISPFTEMKKFVENDEMLSLETEGILYSKCEDFDKLEIVSIKGQLDLYELVQYTSAPNNNSGKSSIFLMTNVNDIDITVKLPETNFNLQMNGLKALINDDFIDLRVKLNALSRQSAVLITDASIGAVATESLQVIEIDGISLTIPHDIYELLQKDVKSIDFAGSSSGGSNNILQVCIKGLSLELFHSELESPVKTNLIVKEAYYKGNSIYFDDLTMKLNNESVFASGLLKIDVNSRVLTNHCSDLTLTPETLKDLLICAQFWSDVYTPAIEEITPEAIFTDEKGGLSESDEEEEEEFNFEFELSEELEKETDFESDLEEDVEIRDAIYKIETEHIRTCEEQIPIDLTDLLNEIDDEFFVRKNETEIIDEKVLLKISDCGFRVNLNSDSAMKVSINLSGIDAKFFDDGISLKIREGRAFNGDKLILSKWPRGPDVTYKHAIEDGNFLNIKSETDGIGNHSGIDEVNLKVSISPIRMFLDQNLLNSLVNFFQVNRAGINDKNARMKAFIFFKKVNISALAIKLDYKVSGTTAISCLKGAEMILPRIELRGIKGVEGLGPAVLSAWIPEVKGKKLTGVLTTGLVPVRTIVNLGGGLVELILLPWQIKGDVSAAQTVAQIRKSGKQIGLETLKLTTSIAKNTSNLLLGGTAEGVNKQKPRDFQTGVQQAAQLIIALPSRLQSAKGSSGSLKAVPLFILDSAATATGALAKTLQGIQAEFDK